MYNRKNVIRFHEKQDDEMLNSFDETLLGVNHVIIGDADYTLCGHATDEYNIDVIKGKITCKLCISLIKECKKIRL